mgnify:CR=1 FL=1
MQHADVSSAFVVVVVIDHRSHHDCETDSDNGNDI